MSKHFLESIQPPQMNVISYMKVTIITLPKEKDCTESPSPLLHGVWKDYKKVLLIAHRRVLESCVIKFKPSSMQLQLCNNHHTHDISLFSVGARWCDYRRSVNLWYTGGISLVPIFNTFSHFYFKKLWIKQPRMLWKINFYYTYWAIPVAYNLWSMVYSLLGIWWVGPSSVREELWAWGGFCKKKILNLFL